MTDMPQFARIADDCKVAVEAYSSGTTRTAPRAAEVAKAA